MKILSVSLQNFASYEKLDFDFTNQGLTLIQGPNGAGKSTLADAIPWILFGKTAKGGAVDEVLSWPGDTIAKGCITLEINGNMFQVLRSRGSAKDNDLMIWEDGGAYRGKDITDTQKLIVSKLGINYDLYLAGSYYHEFSQTAQFFNTTANNRRLICEQLVDLSLPIRLKVSISAQRKIYTQSLAKLDFEQTQLSSNIALLQRLEITENQKSGAWEKQRQSTKEYIIKQYDRFEANRDSTIHDACKECGTVFNAPKHVHDDTVNPYLEKLVELEQQVNPHAGATKDYTEEIQAKCHQVSYIRQEILGMQVLIEELDLLERVTEDLRSTTIQNTIKFIETNTNKLLSDFFDAEIRVEFEAASKDKLEVSIFKDGNTASFSQLSKGQRCLLKLCFGVSVMQAVQNHHGVSFNTLWMDESLDGCSDQNKVKAYRLFEHLIQGYENIFVVEHSESFKSCFENSYSVSLVNGKSQIGKT